MNDMRVNGSSVPQPTSRQSQDADRLAQSILSANSRGTGRDVDGIKVDLDQLQTRNPDLAALVRTIVTQSLSPVERGQLAAANDRGVMTTAQTVTGPDNQPILLAPGAPTVAEHFASPAGSPGRELYNRFDRLFGDGNPATNDVARINTALNELVRNGQSFEQAEEAAMASRSDPMQAASDRIDGRTVADLTQVGLDIVGIFEPTPFADLLNAGISLTRGIYDGITNSSVWDVAAGVGDAAISVAGVFPGIGDTAKVLRLGRHADTVARVISDVAANPALRDSFEPLLRGIKETLDNVSPTVIDALPLGAADSIRAMKAQLDEFFGVGARRADEVVSGAARNIDNIGFTRSQLQHAFDHAVDFGISGNANNQTLEAFGQAIESHLASPATEVITGTYRGNPVTHYLNRETGLNVIVDNSNNLLSGWKLSAAQFGHVTTSGRLGGGR